MKFPNRLQDETGSQDEPNENSAFIGNGNNSKIAVDITDSPSPL